MLEKVRRFLFRIVAWLIVLASVALGVLLGRELVALLIHFGVL